MKLNFFILLLTVGFVTTVSAKENRCDDVDVNFRKMSRELKKLKKDQQFIFPEKNVSFVDTKKVIPEYLNEIFNNLQMEAFGKNLLKLRTVRSFNVSGDSSQRSVDYDPRLIESITKENGYIDPESLLQFILAHEISHFIQDFIAMKKDPIGDELNTFVTEKYLLAHVEVDGYAYLLLKNLKYKLPNREDFTKLISQITGRGPESSWVQRCGLEMRRNFLLRLHQ